MTTRLLELLAELEAQWVRLGAPIVDRLRPGLSDDEIDVVEQRLGFPVARDLRDLWSWHDGADYGGPLANIGPGGYSFLSTDSVVREYERNRRTAPAPVTDLDGDFYWHASWVPFMSQDAQLLYIDCERRDVRSYEGSPVRLVTEEWGDYDVDRYQSLAAAVSTWTWLLASGYYTWEGGFEERWSEIPLFIRWMMQ